jgi:DNA polymerase
MHSLPIAALTEVVLPATVLCEQHVLHRDVECKSPVLLKSVGSHRYAADPRTDVICVAYAVDDEPVQLWKPGEPVPLEFYKAANNQNWVVAAHNNAFEASVEQHILAPRHDFPLIPAERHCCTMTMALALGLPAKLAALADALELANRKDAAGERLMHQMSRPRKPREDEGAAGILYFDDDERLLRLYDYCRQDVETEREIFERLPPLSPSEHALWLLSNEVNDRGFCVDRAFAEAARRIAQAAAPEIDAELAEITGGAVTGINQIARMQSWLVQQGCTAKTLDKKALQKLLGKDDIAPPVRRVLELRLGGAQAAVKKLNALLARAGADDRVRGAFRHHGASTGRWSGEGFQPQNLKRPVVEDIDAAIAAVSTGDYAHVKTLYDRPLAVVGDCSRSMITAARGHALISADFSSIESRVLAWVAGETWKLDAYRKFDAAQDPADEPYRVTAASIFHITADAVTKEQRGAGKICDLAFGFQGGLNAFRKFVPDQFADEEIEDFKKKWRDAHPRIRQFWYDADRAAWTAARQRGRVIQCGRVAFICTGASLRLKLPSGRVLSYPFPRIEIEDARHQHVVFADNAAGQFVDVRHGYGAYGGLWTENIVSGIARDVLAEAMLRVEAAGYPIVLHVHDEIVAEVPIGFGSTNEFIRLMTRKPAWALDLPIAASAWSGIRYCK